MAQCPRCKEDMPILSKICPVCGYVDEGKGEGEDNMSVSQFVQTLEARLSELKYIPEPSFMKGMGHFTYLIYPILTIALTIMALISEAGVFWLGAVLFLILSIVAWVRKSKGILGYAPFNRWFKVVKNDFEYHERIAKQSYGKSREVTTLIDEISGQISVLEKRRASALKRNTLIWSVITVLIIGVSALGVHKVDQTIANIENPQNDPAASKAQWQKDVQEYAKLDKTSYEAVEKRAELVGAMLTSESGAEAQDFFVSECMGQTGDLDCAAEIVKYYVKKGDTAAATGFIERCTAMRYESDKEKLNNLVTQ